MDSPTEAVDPKRDFALYVVRTLREAGFEALWAGGCVRDLVLGLPPKDYDVATNARPQQVQQLFRRTLAIGVSFGVIQVMGNGTEVEVATFRSDGQYTDGRRPDQVTFSSAQEDAQRRDFTINGMFLDPIEDKIIDYVGGRDDLERRIIRAIGDPFQRFEEDKLRMLRAVRFTANLGFELDSQTAQAIRQMANKLSVVSAERILVELRSMLTAVRRVAAVRLLHSTGLFEQIDATVALSYASNTARIESVLGHWRRPIPFPLALAGLLAGIDAKAVVQVAEDLMRRLKAANDERKAVVHLCTHRDALRNPREKRLAYIKRLRAQAGFDDLLDLTEAVEQFETGKHEDADYCRHLVSEWTENDFDPPPVITGEDLIEAGLPPGPNFKPILDAIRDAQLDGVVTNRREGLEMLQQLRASGSGRRQ